MNTHESRHIVVIGGGFGGIQTIKALQKEGGNFAVTLVSNKSYFEYYPGLFKLVSHAVAREVAVPLRDIFPKDVKIIEARVTSVEPTAQRVALDTGESLSYDYLVVALGSQANYFGIPGLAEGAMSFKSVPEALNLKRHLCTLVAQAKGVSEEEARRILAIAIIGGGPSGLELAGDMVPYMQDLAKYEGVDPALVSVHVIEAAPRLLPMLSEKVSLVAAKRLAKLGVVVHLNTALASYESSRIVFKEGELATETVVWTAGTKINDLYSTIPGVVLSEKKRVLVDEYLALQGNDRIFVVGDGAATPFSGLAQTAIHNGAYLGGMLAKRTKQGIVQSYKPHKGSFVIPVGNRWAIASIGGILVTGFIPFLLREMIDFKYFWSILPLRRVLQAGRKGNAYRHQKKICPVGAEIGEL